MSAAESTVVRFEDVTVQFGEMRALDGVSFAVRAGETRVIAGEAASGKTVLLKTAVGLIRPDAGRVFLFDEDISDMKERKLVELRARVGILFQEGGLFDSLTIEENVAYPLENQPGLAETSRGAKGTEMVATRVREALRFVELEKTVDKFPNELSGGMRRRVGIARAVVTQPEAVFYDSPTAGLDPITANLIIRLIISQRDLQNTATLMATHRYQDGHLMAHFRYNPSKGDLQPYANDDPARQSTKFMVMREGRLLFEGSASELASNRDLYIRKFAGPAAVPGAA